MVTPKYAIRWLEGFESQNQTFGPWNTMQQARKLGLPEVPRRIQRTEIREGPMVGLLIVSLPLSRHHKTSPGLPCALDSEFIPATAASEELPQCGRAPGQRSFKGPQSRRINFPNATYAPD